MSKMGDYAAGLAEAEADPASMLMESHQESIEVVDLRYIIQTLEQIGCEVTGIAKNARGCLVIEIRTAPRKWMSLGMKTTYRARPTAKPIEDR